MSYIFQSLFQVLSSEYQERNKASNSSESQGKAFLKSKLPRKVRSENPFEEKSMSKIMGGN